MVSEKHVPIRTCIICGSKFPKRQLLRIVRQKDGTVAIDTHGRSSGRGCYICDNLDQLQTRKARDRIKRVLSLQTDAAQTILDQAIEQISKAHHRC